MKKAVRPPRITSRSQLVHRIRHELEKRGHPRLQMLLLVTMTGGAGFLACVGLLRFGVESLPLRYPLAITIAYLVFLLLLWVWLRTSGDTFDGVDEGIGDIVDAIPDVSARAASHSGAGGQFGGGGSSGHWDAGSKSEPLIELPDVSVPELDVAADADELAIPLAVILVVAAIVLTVVLASASVVLSAPLLFAELIVDGVLAATLYRRLRRIEQRHWLHSAVRRTLVPFAMTAAIAAAVGWGLSIYAPAARTLGEVLATSAR